MPQDEAIERILRRENDRLRREIARLRGETMRPFSGYVTTCPKCGVSYEARAWWEARRRVWLVWFRPERICRQCRLCSAEWYERPLDRETQREDD